MIITLDDKKALVCGGSQGIGKATALLLAESGADVTIVARNQENLKKTVAELYDKKVSLNQEFQYIVADFDKPDELKEQLSDFYTQRQKVDILINNTGGPVAGAAHLANTVEYEVAFRRHLVCNQILLQSVIEGMKINGGGRIVNIISTSVKQPLDLLGVSNTIRGAVASWAKTLANELGQYNITVNNVLPGATRTERLESIIKNTTKRESTAQGFEVSEESIIHKMQSEIPLHRFAEAEEIAAAVVFLCSKQAAYINGINLPVDGGRLKCL